MIRLFESKETDVKLIDLAIKEFEHLKVEARDAITESRLIELNSLVASAAVWAWLFSQLNTVPFHEYIKYIPLILCALGSLRSYALHARLRRIS